MSIFQKEQGIFELLQTFYRIRYQKKESTDFPASAVVMKKDEIQSLVYSIKAQTDKLKVFRRDVVHG
jgi:hypothetical protein